MSENFNDLVKAVLKKTDKLYIPLGESFWRLPSGIPSLDNILGGGFPSGKIAQLFGKEGSGKSTLAYHIVGQAVKLGYRTLLFSMEGYSENYAKACGVDVENELFTVLSGDYAEEVFNICIEGIRNTDLKVVVMDTISAAIPKANIEKKQATDAIDKGPSIGAKARSISYFVEQLQNPIRRNQAIFIAVNQVRTNIGKFSSSLQPTGGLALQFYSDIKINMYGKQDKVSKSVESSLSLTKGKEWKIEPMGTTVLHMQHGVGIDIERDIILQCEQLDIVNKAGSWYIYDFGGETLKFHGSAEFADSLRTKKELREELCNKIRNGAVQ